MLHVLKVIYVLLLCVYLKSRLPRAIREAACRPSALLSRSFKCALAFVMFVTEVIPLTLKVNEQGI